MKRTIDHREGTMQYGAAGMRNLETGITESDCYDKNYTQTTADKPKIQPTNPHVEMIGERPKNDDNNRIYLEKTLERLHDEIKSREVATTEDTPVQPTQRELGGGGIIQEKITQQASDNLKLQTETVRGLCYTS